MRPEGKKLAGDSLDIGKNRQINKSLENAKGDSGGIFACTAGSQKYGVWGGKSVVMDKAIEKTVSDNFPLTAAANSFLYPGDQC